MIETFIKNELKKKGWSYRKAAQVLNIHYVYLANTSNGHYKSKRLERRVEQLPSYELFITVNPNFFNNKPTRKGKNNEQ